MKAKDVNLVRHTLPLPVLHNNEVSLLYSQWYLNYTADTKMHNKYQLCITSRMLVFLLKIMLRAKAPHMFSGKT